MLSLTIRPHERVVITHAGETLVLEVNSRGNANVKFDGPHSFAIVRENAVVKEPKSKEAASDSRN